jgi:hypothetical protein
MVENKLNSHISDEAKIIIKNATHVITDRYVMVKPGDEGYEYALAQELSRRTLTDPVTGKKHLMRGIVRKPSESKSQKH